MCVCVRSTVSGSRSDGRANLRRAPEGLSSPLVSLPLYASCRVGVACLARPVPARRSPCRCRWQWHRHRHRHRHWHWHWHDPMVPRCVVVLLDALMRACFDSSPGCVGDPDCSVCRNSNYQVHRRRSIRLGGLVRFVPGVCEMQAKACINEPFSSSLI